MALVNTNELRGSNTFQRNKGSVTVVTANYTVLPTDVFIDADASAGNFTVTLEALASASTDARNVIVRKSDASANTVTVAGDVNINGAAFVVLSAQYATLNLVAGSTEWMTI